MSTRRLFFALWPTAAMQSALAAAARAAIDSARRARETPAESLHLTLAFLGSVPESSLETLRESACGASREPAGDALREAAGHAPREPVGHAPRASDLAALDMTLDTIDYWPRAQILCATARREPVEVAAFAERFKRSLCEAGFGPDLKPFRAHVTLARQVRGRPADGELSPVRWAFSDFALVESRTGPSGSLYSVLESWPLFRK